jgi:hypothetical protein
MNLLPGWNPGHLTAESDVVGSYVFNGTDELLYRDWVTTSPGQLRFTISAWVKLNDVSVYNGGVQSTNYPTNSEYTKAHLQTYNNNTYQQLFQHTAANEWIEYDNGEPITSNDTWYHVLFIYDSPNANSEDRIKLYVNGTWRDDGGTRPDASDAHYLFENGWRCKVGATDSYFLGGKMAFIDVIDGLAVPVTSFGFDDGGTWTAKLYTGSYGTYGFRLDGSDEFNDVSGNGQHFTPVNMTAGDNIDISDLPPYSF